MSSVGYQLPVEGKGRRWNVPKCGTYQNPTKWRVYINSFLTENGTSTCNYELIAERHTQLIRPWADSSPVHTTSFYFKLEGTETRRVERHPSGWSSQWAKGLTGHLGILINIYLLPFKKRRKNLKAFVLSNINFNSYGQFLPT